MGPDEIMRGDYWSVFRNGESHVLSFMSGELAGCAKQIVISRDEALALVAGTMTAEAVLLAHNAG